MKFLVLLLLSTLLALVSAQPEHPLFPKSELMPGDGKAIPQVNPGFIAQNDKYLFFWVPINETTGTIIFYARDSDGQYSEVNRITVPRMAGTSMTANSEWFVSFNGASRDVIFWQMDANHQVVNSFTWDYQYLSGWANSIHLRANNDMVLQDFTPQGHIIAIYPYSNGSWPTQPTDKIPCDAFAIFSITEDRVASFNKTQKIVRIYAINGDHFTYLENVTVPFTIPETGNVPWTYNGDDTIVFVYSPTKIGVMKKNETAWNAYIVNRPKDEDHMNSFFLWRGSDLYFSSMFNDRRMNVTTQTPQGSLFKFSKLDDTDSWNITEVYSSASNVGPYNNFITTHFWGFTVTDKAIYSLSVAYNKTLNINGASQLFYTPFCYDDPIALTCVEKSFLACSPVTIDASELYTIDDDCANEVSLNSSATVQATFGSDNAFKTTISVSRFEYTAQCEVTVRCNVIPVPPSSSPSSSPSGSPSSTPGRGNTPGTSQTSLAFLTNVSFFGVISALFALL